MHFSVLSHWAVVVTITYLGVAALPAATTIINNAAIDVVPDSYIVAYKRDTNAKLIRSHEEKLTKLLKDGPSSKNGVGKRLALATFQGYQVRANRTTIEKILALPEVDYIEKDGIMSTSDDLTYRSLVTQGRATWGLGRVSHRNPGSTDYIYDNVAFYDTRVYVIDTGIYTAHSEFGGRAIWGANFVVGSPDSDENGHGTHCAGTIGGVTYGVSKKTTLVAVKVLNASGSGSFASVIAGIQWAVTDASSLGYTSKSVLSMSLGGGYSASVNAAVASAVASGVTVVVAAGNSNANAANYSPASAAAAITVGAIDSSDNRASFSNFGSILDIFAPGVGIRSSWIGNTTTGTASLSGTSMATPHVAGLAAYLLGREKLTTPASVANRIIKLATLGKVKNQGSGSPNRISYNGSSK